MRPAAGQGAPGTGQGTPGTGQGTPGSGQGVPGGGLPAAPGSSPTAGQAWLGVELAPSSTGGALISGIVAGGPADAAALHPGDVILGLNGRSVASSQEVNNAISALSPGQTVSVRVQRASTAFTTQVTLGQRPSGYP